VFTLMVAEAGTLALLGVVGGVFLTCLLVLVGRSMLAQRFGIYVPVALPSVYDLEILGTVVLAALAMGLLPAARAYRRTLSDGLQIRV